MRHGLVMDDLNEKLLPPNDHKQDPRMGKYRRYFAFGVVVLGAAVVYIVYNGSISTETFLPKGRLKTNWKSVFHDRQKAAQLKALNDKSKSKNITQLSVSPEAVYKSRVIFIIGDSHIKHLEEAVASGTIHGASRNFDQERTVRTFGIPGATVDRLRGSEELIELLLLEKPEFVVLHVGGNDLDSDTSVVQVCGNIAKYVQELQNLYGVKSVLYSEQFHRRNTRAMPHLNYDRKLIEMNKMLGSLYRGLFWTNSKLMQAKKDILSEDGVHLNDYGQQLFYQSFVDALKHLLSLQV